MNIEIIKKIDAILNHLELTSFFQLVAGSRLFGTANMDSDMDIRVVGLPKPEYYNPASRGLILGIDGDVSQAKNMIANYFIEDKKWDVFVDSFPKYIYSCINGGYYELQNFLTPNEKYYSITEEAKYVKSKLIACLPSHAFRMGSLFFRKKIRDYDKRLHYVSQFGCSKIVAQSEFVKDFLITRNPLPESKALELRNTDMNKEDLTRHLKRIDKEIELVYGDDRTINKEESNLFNKEFMKSMNEIYKTEVFTI